MANRTAMSPAGRMINWSVLASIRTEGPPPWADDRVPTRRVACAARVRTTGMPARDPSEAFVRGRAGGGECNKAREAGSNSPATGDIHLAEERATPTAGGGVRPYTAALLTRRPFFGCLFEIVETLVLTLIIFLVIQTFVAQPYKVQQQSMEHTLEPDQYVLVDKLTARFDDYKRGDIVVFNPPAAWAQGDGTPFIKRVIGVGG